MVVHLLDVITAMPCVCGGGTPQQGWMAPPYVAFVQCPSCGAMASGEVEGQAVARWNAQCAKAKGAAA